MSRFFKLLHYLLVLLLLHSCSEVTNLSQSSAISDPLPPATPETNTLYTTMQWETSSPAEEGMDSALLDTAFNNAFADDTLKKDKNIMLTAIKDNGDSLEHAHSSLKKDKDVVLAAIKSSGSAIEYADASFQKDKKIVLMAVSKSSEALDYAPSSGEIVISDKNFNKIASIEIDF